MKSIMEVDKRDNDIDLSGVLPWTEENPKYDYRALFAYAEAKGKKVVDLTKEERDMFVKRNQKN